MKNLIVKVTALMGIMIVAIALAPIGILNAMPPGSMSKEIPMAEVKSPNQVKDLEPGDSIAMVCGKCKTVAVYRVRSGDSKGRTQWLQPGTEMKCPGCGGKITTKSGGKESRIVHVCSSCGSGSAFCCATRRGQKTDGM
ncbi:MAG: hypothetical protein ACAI35_24160 [Candidatus Methylacidiphilales bacterium]|nr:hypothetical protein [Candidatus Methylacidiphilales bacterium]